MENTKVTDLGQLEDKKLAPELKKRLADGRLTFITSEDCRAKLAALKGKVSHKSASELWQPLLEDAIEYLKRSDPREWAEEYGEPNTEEKSSLKAFGVEKLNDYFVQFKEFEKILYGAERYYHDHTLHVFRVWMLGTLLLDDWFRDKKHPYIEFFNDVAEKMRGQVGSLISAQEIQAMWCVIALSHDLGYPLQKVDSINEQTRRMLRQYAKVNLQDLNFDVPQQHQFINDFILKFISSTTILPDKTKEEDSKEKQGLRTFIRGKERVFSTHVQSKYYLKYSKSLEDFEHGIFSAILLMRSLTYFLESDFDMDDRKKLDFNDAKQCAIRREILRAIACHTCEEIYHIRPDTLGFLLIVCDELQSWGRPTFEEMQNNDESSQPLAKLNKFSPKEVDYELKFPGDEKELSRRTKVLFRRFHKILRVAVAAPQREFSCQVTVMSLARLPYKYRFGFEARKPRFQFTMNGKQWDPWEEDTR